MDRPVEKSPGHLNLKMSVLFCALILCMHDKLDEKIISSISTCISHGPSTLGYSEQKLCVIVCDRSVKKSLRYLNSKNKGLILRTDLLHANPSNFDMHIARTFR